MDVWVAPQRRTDRFAEKLHFMCKTMEPPPEKHAGLTDPELRQRQRYLSTYVQRRCHGYLHQAHQDRAIVRDTLNRRGYCEIEGPTLHTIAGGAAARPFLTHHNALNMPLFMRIALELHLKRLLVGGMERVYELGRVYRNEGITHATTPSSP